MPLCGYIKCNYSENIIIVSEENRGYANGNNIGIKYALDHGCEYICLLNSDVVVEEDFLEPLVENITSEHNIGIVGPCICEYSKRNYIQAMGAEINLYVGLAQRKFNGRKYSNINKKILNVDYLGGACFLFNKNIIEKIGLIPENYFLFYEETEFCLRAKKAGYKLLCIHNSRVYHKGSATISKFKGLSYFFLNRNRIIFMRRNANIFQKIIFSIYLIFETIGRMLIRKENFELLKYYYIGMKADINNIGIKEVKSYLNN